MTSTDLYLYVDPDVKELSIRDEQDMIWLLFFRREGIDNREELATSVVLGTCKGLGITEAWTFNGTQLTLAEAINLWL